MKKKKRLARESRKTKETDISVKLAIDGSGKTKIKTGIGFLDHMLELFAFHGFFDLEVTARGDLQVDIHHTNEDVGLMLGRAFKKALGDKKGIRRFGFAQVPMEEVTAAVALDINGRGFFSIKEAGAGLLTGAIQESPGGLSAVFNKQEDYEFEYAEHFFDAFAKNTGMNLNILLFNPKKDLHAVLEPVFKALGLALDQATGIDPRRKGVPSTKGVID
ncbi:MAG: imidazoleglycerol-phosphate dehydratase [Candidatus Omnitrophota bacterium]|jgi:imidazoleglycerol-phosphate dehydratase